jgi:hypothetical protein
MENIIRCTRCILPNTLSNISFNKSGVCNYCLKYESDFKDWELIENRKEKEFNEILNRTKSLKRPYDCLIPLSGGKDSTYALYLSTKVYNLKTLAVTFDNGYLSNIAKENIRNAITSCDADHFFYTVNKKNSTVLFTSFLQNTGGFCNACMRGINYTIEVAVNSFRIPLVLKGAGRRVEYVSQIQRGQGLNSASYFANVIKKTKAEKIFFHFYNKKHKSEFQKIAGGICDILGIPRTTLMRFIPQHIAMYDYIYKPFPEIVNIIKKEMNWSDAHGAVEHLDCELHDVPFFNNTLKIENITQNTFYRSGLIRQGLLNRDEALKLEEDELGLANIPFGLDKFLNDNKIIYSDYEHYVKNAHNEQYVPKLQKIARDVYHKFRRF